MPVGRGARRAMCGKVVPQPADLRGVGAAADEPAVAVEHDQVPRTEVVTVVPELRITRGRAEIPEVAPRARGAVIVVAERRSRSRAVASPAGMIAVRELLVGPELVGIVTGREHRARNGVEQPRRGFIPEAPAARDVTCADQHGGNLAYGRGP